MRPPTPTASYEPSAFGKGPSLFLSIITDAQIFSGSNPVKLKIIYFVCFYIFFFAGSVHEYISFLISVV